LIVHPMKKTSIDSARPGDLVARPVVSASGVILVAAGAVLRAEMISRLRELGIERLWVEGEAEDAKTPEQMAAELDRRFLGHEHDPLMAELKAIVASLAAADRADSRD